MPEWFRRCVQLDAAAARSVNDQSVDVVVVVVGQLLVAAAAADAAVVRCSCCDDVPYIMNTHIVHIICAYVRMRMRVGVRFAKNVPAIYSYYYYIVGIVCIHTIPICTCEFWQRVCVRIKYYMLYNMNMLTSSHISWVGNVGDYCEPSRCHLRRSQLSATLHTDTPRQSCNVERWSRIECECKNELGMMMEFRLNTDYIEELLMNKSNS